MRLIDANELIKTYEKETGYTWSAKGILECPKCFIDDAPTIEYPFYKEAYQTGYEEGKNERPQGKWIRTGSLGNGNAHYECSNCHYGDEHAENQEVPYCWHCGADMRGEKK